MQRQRVPHGLSTGFRRIALLAALASFAGLAACTDESRLPRNSRHYVALSPELTSLMSEKGMSRQSPILLRTYKKESELEVWKVGRSGRYELLKTFPMCRWSGQLGPKKREGDRQVPEGFYAITPQQLNPNSAYYLSFNIGYPNTYDRSFGRTGAHIMVHGACSSAGCFSMTDEQIADIYALTREAFGGGQQAVQLQSLPFRMSPENLAKFRADENMGFWKNLKEGADLFEVTKLEPKVTVCSQRYVFGTRAKDGRENGLCAPLERDEDTQRAVAARQKADEVRVAELVAAGTRAVKRIYKDGDQHHSFKAPTAVAALSTGDRDVPVQVARASVSRVAEVSRPDALDGIVEVPVEELKGGRTRLAAATPRNPVDPLTTASAPARPQASQPTQAAPAVQAASAPAATSPPAAAAAFAAEEASSEPFYRRWFSLGPDKAKAESAEPATPQPASVPLPPKAPNRQQVVSTRADRHATLSPADLPAIMRGGTAILPQGLSAFVAVER